MWKKNEPEQPAPQPKSQPSAPPRNYSPASTGERAMIGPTIEIKGDLVGGEDLLIDGRIEGKIELKQNNVTVGKSGRVKADILGKLITVEGEVHGNLYGEEQLILRESSTVRGNIKCPRVILEDGSNFKGSIDMAPLTSAPVRPSLSIKASGSATAHPKKVGPNILLSACPPSPPTPCTAIHRPCLRCSSKQAEIRLLLGE